MSASGKRREEAQEGGKRSIFTSPPWIYLGAEREGDSWTNLLGAAKALEVSFFFFNRLHLSLAARQSSP